MTADHIRPIDGLTDEVIQHGTMGREWISDQVRRADGLPHFADMRDGDLIDDPPRLPWVGIFLFCVGAFWAWAIVALIAP